MLPRGYPPRSLARRERENRIVLGDLDAEGWREAALDSIMVDFIHFGGAVQVGLICAINWFELISSLVIDTRSRWAVGLIPS